jgi:hypothetical protein
METSVYSNCEFLLPNVIQPLLVAYGETGHSTGTCGLIAAREDGEVFVDPSCSVVVELVHIPGRTSRKEDVELLVRRGRKPDSLGGQQSSGPARQGRQVLVFPGASVVRQLVNRKALARVVIDVDLGCSGNRKGRYAGASHGG